MEFFEVLQKRRSIRAYRKDAPVKEEDVNKILEAANSAPSGGNLQPYKIIVVKSEEGIKALQSSTRQVFISQAPVSFVFCVDSSCFIERYGERGRSLYAIQDAAIACTYAQLAATALGLASIWVGAFDEAKVSSALKLPSNLRPVAILPVGYPAAEPGPYSRKPLEEITVTM